MLKVSWAEGVTLRPARGRRTVEVQRAVVVGVPSGKRLSQWQRRLVHEPRNQLQCLTHGQIDRDGAGAHMQAVARRLEAQLRQRLRLCQADGRHA